MELVIFIISQETGSGGSGDPEESWRMAFPCPIGSVGQQRVPVPTNDGTAEMSIFKPALPLSACKIPQMLCLVSLARKKKKRQSIISCGSTFSSALMRDTWGHSTRMPRPARVSVSSDLAVRCASLAGGLRKQKKKRGSSKQMLKQW